MSVPLTAVHAMRSAMIEASFLLRDDAKLVWRQRSPGGSTSTASMGNRDVAERLRSARRLRWLAGVGGLPS